MRTIQQSRERIRKWLQSCGMTAREIAPLAGLTDPTVYKAMMPDSRLSVETWEKLESIVPPDFEPDTNQDAAA